MYSCFRKKLAKRRHNNVLITQESEIKCHCHLFNLCFRAIFGCNQFRINFFQDFTEQMPNSYSAIILLTTAELTLTFRLELEVNFI